MRNVLVDTGRKRYSIHIGAGLSHKTGKLAAKLTGPTKAALITDDNVDRLWSEQITKSLESAGFKVSVHVIPNGECSKNIENYIKILGFLSENKLSRGDTLFALGGGMVGDIAGFAASTYLRGIRFVQIPTTLLAMVDSSVGGKTAVNLDSGKNQAGTFYQPDLVVCDPELLSSLPDDIFRDGCAEVVKYGVIADGRLFDMLKGSIEPQLEEVIERCLTIKSRLVYEDEFDTGARQLLNFGRPDNASETDTGTGNVGIVKRSGWTDSSWVPDAISERTPKRITLWRHCGIPNFSDSMTKSIGDRRSVSPETTNERMP